MRLSVDEFTSHRVRYKDAGAAMRSIIARAAASRPHLGQLEWRALAAVLDRTVSYSKLCDSTTMRELAQLAQGTDEVHGHDRRHVRDALHRLADRDIGLSITPTGRGRYARVVISIDHPMDPFARFLDDGLDDAMNPLAALNEPSESPPMNPLSAAHLEAEKCLLEKRPELEEVGAPAIVDDNSIRERARSTASKEERRVVERGIRHFGPGRGELVRSLVRELAAVHGLPALDDALGVAELQRETHPVFLRRYLDRARESVAV
jgi:hypothetical protein